MKLPALFIGHGSPMNAIEDNEFSRRWRQLGQTLPKPKAILCVSAHWETSGVFVTAHPNPETLHDFHGFPQALFDERYPSPGDPVLAQRVATMLGAGHAGHRGLAHGAWRV